MKSSGLGQINNGQSLKGLLTSRVRSPGRGLLSWILIGFVFAFIVRAWAIYDAYQEAEQINARYGGPRVR